jgi:hypothetical protein
VGADADGYLLDGGERVPATLKVWAARRPILEPTRRSAPERLGRLLTTSSNLTGAWTGNSLGFVPLGMRSAAEGTGGRVSYRFFGRYSPKSIS